MNESYLPVISNVLGWTFVISWGLFAYPQMYLNYKLKNTEGFKIDYPFLNLSGFIWYSVAYSVGYFNPDMPYDNYGLSTVRIQDIVFAYHNLITNLILNIQAFYIFERGDNHLTTFSKIFTIFAWISVLVVLLVTEVFGWIPVSRTFNVLIYLGYLKVFITCTKYIPLIYWNYKRKSTKGFSILSFSFDLIGGITMSSQELVDFIDGTAGYLSPVKLMLGMVCAAYDIILMFQHFIIYKGSTKERKAKPRDSQIEALEILNKSQGSHKDELSEKGIDIDETNGLTIGLIDKTQTNEDTEDIRRSLGTSERRESK